MSFHVERQPEAASAGAFGCGTTMIASGTIANAAVTRSIAITAGIGIVATRSAPSGAETINAPPWSAWFSPWIRVRCSDGTMSVVEASIAGAWNAPQTARKAINASTIHGET